MELLTFTATGIYDREISLELVQGLVEEMQRRLEAYGFKEIHVITWRTEAA